MVSLVRSLLAFAPRKSESCTLSLRHTATTTETVEGFLCFVFCFTNILIRDKDIQRTKFQTLLCAKKGKKFKYLKMLCPRDTTGRRLPLTNQ